MRLKPKIVVERDVCNQSSREGAKPELIVLHSTEGNNVPDSAADLAGLAAFFNNPATAASSHVATDSDGHSSRMVPDERKAWTCASFNRVSLNVEMIGKAATEDWSDEQIRETARWIARWSLKHDIPIREAVVRHAAVVKSGVIRHSQLGAYGGGHSDPGSAFPFARCLREAHEIKLALRRS